MRKYKLSNGRQSMVVYARSEAEALNSACADYLMGDGPIFNAISVEVAP